MQFLTASFASASQHSELAPSFGLFSFIPNSAFWRAIFKRCDRCIICHDHCDCGGVFLLPQICDCVGGYGELVVIFCVDCGVTPLLTYVQINIRQYVARENAQNVYVRVGKCVCEGENQQE